MALNLDLLRIIAREIEGTRTPPDDVADKYGMRPQRLSNALSEHLCIDYCSKCGLWVWDMELTMTSFSEMLCKECLDKEAS